jgi:hypothetical protein
MTAKTIHFAYDNSSPSKTYNRLFSHLAVYQINYLERHAHNPRFTITEGWTFLKDELRKEIERLSDQSVIGVCYSLRGILHFLVTVVRGPNFTGRSF